MNLKHMYSKAGRGFTLIEVLVSVALLSVVAIYFIQIRIDAARQNIVEQVASEVMSIANMASAYYVDNEQWPTNNETGPNACSDVQDFLETAGLVPVDYQFVADVSLSFTCTSTPIGQLLRIQVDFGNAGDEMAAILLSYLPNSEKVVGAAQITHYLAPPRKMSRYYNFHREALQADAKFTINKPDCPRLQDPQVMLIPQAVCIGNAPEGLGGYYFKLLVDGRNSWQYQIRVARGLNNNIDSLFFDMTSTCGAVPVYIGAITYCE